MVSYTMCELDKRASRRVENIYLPNLQLIPFLFHSPLEKLAELVPLVQALGTVLQEAGLGKSAKELAFDKAQEDRLKFR